MEAATSATRAGRFRAPVSYPAIRRAYNTMRAAAGATIVAGGIAAWVTTEAGAAPHAVVVGAVMAADGWYRRSRGASAQPLLLVDVLIIGTLLLTQGHTPSIEAAGFVYILAAALLLLARWEALALIALLAAWAVPIAIFAPVVQGPETTDVILEAVGGTALVALIAQLLLSTGRALHLADESQREALETQRRAVEIKNEFVSMVSHELRTPLTSIAGFTDALRESWSNLDDEEIEEFLVIMRRETGHLRDLVEDILVIPRLETGHLRMDAEVLDLRKECFDIADFALQDSTTEFDIDIPASISVNADPVRLRQVMRNLLENALKYGGDQVLIEGEPDGSMVRVVVTDNGPGVPEIDRERIFDHFEQLTKGDSRVSQGVGLGLPIARKLVRAMGGDLWYESRFPTGSRFCFTLPTAATVTAVEAIDQPAG